MSTRHTIEDIVINWLVSLRAEIICILVAYMSFSGIVLNISGI